MTGVEIALAISAVGSAVSAVGASSAGSAAKKAANFNAAVGEANARAARRDATENFDRHQRDAARRGGTLRNQLVSLDALEDQAMEEELDAQTILHQGEISAMGFERGAGLDRSSGRTAQRAGFVSAAGSLLKGGASLSEALL